MTNQFLELLESEYARLENHPQRRSREKFWENFQRIGLPTKKTEVYKYVRLRKLFENSYEASRNIKTPNLLFPCFSENRLIFVNGTYRPELSTCIEEIIVLPLTEAIKTYGSFLTNQWNQSLKIENDPFASFNGALYDEGVFIYLPPKSLCKQPLHILHLIDGNSQLLMPRCHIFGSQQAEATIALQTVRTNGEQYGVNQVTEISLDDEAHLKVIQLDDCHDNRSWQFHALRGQLKKGSSLTTHCVSDGSLVSRYDYRVSLLGEGSAADLKGIHILQGNREAHTNVLIEHRAPSCTSSQLFKTVLDDNARTSFEGKIYVEPIAQQTNAYQLNANLLLNDAASANCKPNLEIFADDVKASHGATFGQLEEEEIFYLKSRGLSEGQAKSLLIRGFCHEILETVPVEALRELMIHKAKSMFGE